VIRSGHDRFARAGLVGGRDRDRTGDPLLAKQVLSQLSYTPTVGVTLILKHSRARAKIHSYPEFLVYGCWLHRTSFVMAIPCFRSDALAETFAKK
jgi:hypothetical protein